MNIINSLLNYAERKLCTLYKQPNRVSQYHLMLALASVKKDNKNRNISKRFTCPAVN